MRGVTPVLGSPPKAGAEVEAAAPSERREPSRATRLRELLPRVVRRLDGRRSSTAALAFFLLLLRFCSGGGTGSSTGTATGSGSCTRFTDARLARMGAGRPAGDASPAATDVLNCALAEIVTDWVRTIPPDSLCESTGAGRSQASAMGTSSAGSVREDWRLEDWRLKRAAPLATFAPGTDGGGTTDETRRL